MQQKYNIFLIYIIIPLFTLCSCSKSEQIIPPRTMSRIISEIYLADQYIEDTPKYRAQMDTVYLYEAITLKYGYTYQEYQMATRYYLQDGNSMKKIYIKARDFLTDRKRELAKILKIESAAKVHFWATDSIKGKEINNLWKEPYLRTLYWLTSYNKVEQPESWRFTDTATFDTPQNSLWWINNIRINDYNYMNRTLPVLTKDYVIRTGNSVAGKSDMQRALEERMRQNEEAEKNKPEIKKEEAKKDEPKKVEIKKDGQRVPEPQKEDVKKQPKNKELKKPEITKGELKKDNPEPPKTNPKARIKKQDRALSIELKDREK